jgi:uncharacterized protein (DUF1778 family)
MARRRASKRAVTITVRAEKRQWEIIDRAATAVGKSRSVVLDAALSAATKRPSVHRLVVSARSFRRLLAELEGPPRSNPNLQRLLATKAPWRS